MKKILLSLIVVLQLIIYIPVSAEVKEVPVYMFTKDGCSACNVAHDYFEDLENEYPDLFELIVIEVFDKEGEQTSNAAVNLLVNVYEYLEQDTSRISTPTIIVGDYHTFGFPQDEDEIYDAIIKVKESKESTVDIVKSIANDLEINIDNIDDIDAVDNVQKDTNQNNYDVFIIIGIFVVLIGGCVGLVVIGKK